VAWSALVRKGGEGAKEGWESGGKGVCVGGGSRQQGMVCLKDAIPQTVLPSVAETKASSEPAM
jgi:hypothetical protein